jgi:hypothetical protein
VPSNRWSQTLTGPSSTAGYPLYITDWMKRAGPFNLGISCVLGPTSTSTAAYNVEVTNDYTGSSTFTSTAATWFSSFGSALVAGALLQITTPVTAVRLNVTAGASNNTNTMTIVSAG